MDERDRERKRGNREGYIEEVVKGGTRNGTKSAAGAVKSLALITEGSKENDGSRYSIMFLRFAREEGETVYLCY